MSEIQISTPLVQPEFSREHDLEALRAFDEKYPEYAFDPSNEKLKWVEKNDFFNDQDVASIFENAVAGIEASIIESSVIDNHQVDLSGNIQVPLSSWACGTKCQNNTEVDSEQQFPYDFDSFEQEHWEFYTNQILNDESLMMKSWDDLISWLSDSYIKFKAEQKGDKAAKASEKRPLADQGQKDHDSNSASQRSESRNESRNHLGEGRAQYPMAPPQRNRTNGAASSPYQNTNASGGNPPVPSSSNLHRMSNQQTPSHPVAGLGNDERLHHSQRGLDGRTRPVQGSVQQDRDPRNLYQQPHGLSIDNINTSQAATASRNQGALQGMHGTPRPHRQQSHGTSIGHTNISQPTPHAQYHTLVQGNNGTPKARYQQLHDPSVGYVNISHSTPPIGQEGFAPGMNGAPKVQHPQSHGLPTSSTNTIQSIPSVRQQSFAQGTNGTPRAQHQQPRGSPIGSTNTIQSTPSVRQQGFAQGTNGTPRVQNRQFPGPPNALTNNSQSTPLDQYQRSVQGMMSIPRNQLSTLGPGGRTDREVPRQILGRRGREATEDDDDVIELDPSVYTSQFSEDGSRSKRRRNNADNGTNMRPQTQRRQNGTPRPQYYGAAGAPVPIGLPEELSRNTNPPSGFVGNAIRPRVPPKAIDSNGRLTSSNQENYTPNQAAPNVRSSPNLQAGYDGLAAGSMNGGRSTSHVSGNYLGSLQHTHGGHQAQQIPAKLSREENIGKLRQGTNDTQQAHGVEGHENYNDDRHRQAQHGVNLVSGPPQLLTGGLNHPPPVSQSSCSQQPGRILGEVLDDFGPESEGDVPPKISRKRNRSESMNAHEEEAHGPAAKRRRTPSIGGPNLAPEAPRRDKSKRRKSKQDEHLPPPVFTIDDNVQDASHNPQVGATEQADEIISATNHAPHVTNAQAPNPPQADEIISAPNPTPHVANSPAPNPPNPPPPPTPTHLPPPDIRDHPPTTEWDCIRLTAALDHTRWAYEQWTGTDAPATDRLLSYNAQFGTILGAFGKWWHSEANPERGVEMEWLVQLDPWEGGVADWREPGKDGLWWECVRRGFYALRGGDGGLMEPEFRMDYRDYEWFDEGGVEGLM